MKRLPAIFPILLTAVLFFVSCGETKEKGEHDNWNQRNLEYISNLAPNYGDTDPESAIVGQRFRILSYKLDPERTDWSNTAYVYCEVLSKGTDTISPKYTDSIRINYRVRLMPTDNYPEGQVVDQSFKTANLDPTVNVPSSFRVSGMIDGVSTAVMHMHCGDFWKLYIPNRLGYGSSDKGVIPAYSTLIFEINLTEIARTGHDLSPR